MKHILVVFGGRSSEHEVSLKSVVNIVKHIDLNKYKLSLAGIKKDGTWVLVDNVDNIENGTWMNSSSIISLFTENQKAYLFVNNGKSHLKESIDIAFPVLHGLYGEDGSIQGLFEMLNLPYVGCGILASACSMDKFYTKIIVDTTGMKQAKYILCIRENIEKDIKKEIEIIEKKFGYPVFVKPCNAGSSMGVNKAKNKKELEFALLEASKHDRKILVEEFIKARELECAILADNEYIKASCIGEIKAAAEFYDYDAKYNNEQSLTIVNPNVDEEIVEKIKESAIKIFRALSCYGLSRVDFFLTENNEIVFNEINTLPGFTAISMYPMLFEASGINKYELVDTLIGQALRR